MWWSVQPSMLERRRPRWKNKRIFKGVIMDTNLHRWRNACALAAAASLWGPVTVVAQTTASPADSLPLAFSWTTVANSASLIPGGDGRTFNSFNQPSVNYAGLVVIRGRSKGGGSSGEPLRGIYSRQVGGVAGPLMTVFDTKTTVPQPNNILYSGQLGTFTEFPAFPRIGMDNSTMTSRAQSKPVYEYQVGVDPATGLPITTRIGTSGVYALRQGERVAAMSQLGAVAGFDHFSVPGATPGTKFDQFPGSPSVANTNAVVFKGNFTDGASKTGIFFRTFNPSGVPSKTQVIASSDTLIPGQPEGGVKFGSTSPPSGVGKEAVFLGLDNEQTPTLGGIYLAPIEPKPALRTLVSIGGQVPGESSGTTFTRLGEALSFDGRFVAFWGAWGSAVRSTTLYCPEDGQAAVIAFCKLQYPAGLTVSVPANQGFFVHDVKNGKTHVAVKTGGEFVDFLYWTFSGRPPGVGDSDSEDFEEPRWRSASFAATYTTNGKAQVAFKARKPTTPVIDGLYLTVAPSAPSVYRTIVETASGATLVDAAAPAGALVTSVGLERDGLRNGWLSIAASMLDPVTGESWAGVYLTRTDRK
jgi:hypothetical protein